MAWMARRLTTRWRNIADGKGFSRMIDVIGSRLPNVRRAWLPLLTLLVILLIWQIAAGSDTSHYQVIPSPLTIFERMITSDVTLWTADIPLTALETVLGLLIALAIGMLTAALLDYSEPFKLAIYPLLVTSQTIPVVALAPVLILAFGFGIEIKIVLVILFCFFPICVAMIDGLAATDPDYVALLRAMGASRAQVWRMARFPSALPSLFSGLRIAATYAMTGAIVGEFITANNGLGHVLRMSFSQSDIPRGFGAIAITAILSVILVLLVNLIERVAMPWYFTQARIQQWTEPGIF